MLLKSDLNVVVIGLSEYVIKSGERKGEVVNRVSISNGHEVLQDLSLPEDFDVKTLQLFTQPYVVMFDYAVRSYGDKIYKQFSIHSLVPAKG